MIFSSLFPNDFETQSIQVILLYASGLVSGSLRSGYGGEERALAPAAVITGGTSMVAYCTIAAGVISKRIHSRVVRNGVGGAPGEVDGPSSSGRWGWALPVRAMIGSVRI